MRKVTISSFSALACCYLASFGEARPVESACIKSLPLFGHEIGDKDKLPEYSRVDGDMNDIASMSLLSLAYSRPSTLLVCSDSTRIHGVRLTLKMHETQDSDYSQFEEIQDDIKKLNRYIDIKSSAYAPLHMKMVGTYTTPCKNIDIEHDDKIMYIDLVAD